MPSLKERASKLRTELVSMWNDTLISNDGVGGEISSLLADVATLMTDVVRLAENPDLEQVDCYNTGGTIHIIGSGLYRVLCDKPLDLRERVMPQHCIPTCPNCIAKWRREKSKAAEALADIAKSMKTAGQALKDLGIDQAKDSE